MVKSQFSYCLLVWMFCSQNPNNLVNKTQDRRLRLIMNDKTSSFEHLQQANNEITTHQRNLQMLMVDFFKIINGFGPPTVFEIRTFHLAGYFSWKAHEPLNLNKEIQKSAMGLGVTVTYACSVGSIYFAILTVWITFSWCLYTQWALFILQFEPYELPFPDVFNKLIFLYASSFSPKSVSSSHHQTNTHHVGVLNLPNQISLKWILNPGQDWHEMQICN